MPVLWTKPSHYGRDYISPTSLSTKIFSHNAANLLIQFIIISQPHLHVHLLLPIRIRAYRSSEAGLPRVLFL